jgi:hypothetical protein
VLTQARVRRVCTGAVIIINVIVTNQQSKSNSVCVTAITYLCSIPRDSNNTVGFTTVLGQAVSSRGNLLVDRKLRQPDKMLHCVLMFSWPLSTTVTTPNPLLRLLNLPMPSSPRAPVRVLSHGVCCTRSSRSLYTSSHNLTIKYMQRVLS